MTSVPRIEVVAHVIPRAGNLRFSPLSSYITQDLLSSFLSYFLTMRPIIAGSSVPRPPRPSASPTSSSSSGTSGGVPAVLLEPPSPSPQREACEPSEEDSEEYDDTHTSSNTSHSSVDISSVDASQGSDRESISFDSDPSSRSSFDNESLGRWSGSTISSGSVYVEDDLVNRHFANTFPLLCLSDSIRFFDVVPR
ncbi:hypothetical protein PIB30_035680 [Stylosanthes scabra]|uniref:Uncharacterized protein n=1 Tax=Stylosanthes scabra TaxID=79078 RepID=A0ABU6UCI9_9FABA|nr:hypothetical protein [Stylosanthes scabra]